MMEYSYPYISSYDLEDTWKKINYRGHSLHRMCSRTGSFPPSLAHYFIWKFSKAGDRVLDPFSGKGTAPLEACIAERIGIGNDVAPEAYVLTHSKVKPVSLTIIKKYLKSLKEKIKHEKNCANDIDEDVKIFFHPETLKQIVALRNLLFNCDSNKAIFVKALMCGIIHGFSELSLSLPCSHLFSMSPKYVKKYKKEHKLKRPHRDVIACLERKAEIVLEDELYKIRGEAYQKDASELPLEEESIDLIVTSPPYFKAQTYAWDNWLRLWFLGYNYREVEKKLLQTESREKYVKFMTEYIKKMYQVLKDNSACFLVVGDVNVRGKKIKTAEFLTEPAESAGFKVRRVIIDAFPGNNCVSKKQRARTDRILELHKGRPQESHVGIRWTL